MLVYLIPGTGISAADSNSDQVVAEIGKSAVTVDEVQQHSRMYLQNSACCLPSSPLPIFLSWWIRPLPSGPWLTKRNSSDFEFQIAIWRIPCALSRLQPCLRINTSNTWNNNFGTTVPAFEENVRVKSYEDEIDNIVAGRHHRHARRSGGGISQAQRKNQDGLHRLHSAPS